MCTAGRNGQNGRKTDRRGPGGDHRAAVGDERQEHSGPALPTRVLLLDEHITRTFEPDGGGPHGR